MAASNMDMFKDKLNFNSIFSDNFKLILIPFSNQDSFYYETGSIHRQKGYFKKYDIYRPLHIINNTAKYDDELLSLLKYQKGNNKNIYKRIIYSSESMMDSYYNSDNRSENMRILSQIMSFEILFQFKNQTREKFIKKICESCEPKNEKKTKYKLKRGKERTGTIHEKWADDFYLLRNSIIHGEKIIEEDFNFYVEAHFVLGLKFYIISIKQLLNNKSDEKLYFIDNEKFKVFTLQNKKWINYTKN